jgi:hypothetical protein
VAAEAENTFTEKKIMKNTKNIICSGLLLSLATTISFAQKGVISFFDKKIDYNKATTTGGVSEYILGEPLYMSTVFEKTRQEACKDCEKLNLRFSLGDITYSSTQMRSDYYDIYSAAAGPEYYCSDAEAAIQLISGKGWYFEGYDLCEDGFRLFLNKINGKLLPGATVAVKVELVSAKDNKDLGSIVLATGTLNIKVTDKLKDPTNFLVRTTPMLADAEAEKAIGEQFKATVTSTAKIFKVTLTGNYNYKRNPSTSINENKNVDANVWYKNMKNECWVAKFNFIFEAEGSGFSKLAKKGKGLFVAPVPCACFEK